MKKTNMFCIVGIILSLIIPTVGMIVSIVGVDQVNHNSNEDGMALGLTGITVGAIGTIIVTYVLIILLLTVWTAVMINT